MHMTPLPYKRCIFYNFCDIALVLGLGSLGLPDEFTARVDIEMDCDEGLLQHNTL